MCFSFWLIKSDIQNKQLQHLEKKNFAIMLQVSYQRLDQQQKQ